MKKKAIFAISAALLAGTVMIAGAQTANKGTIEVASQSPLSGPQANLGEAIKLGVQLAVRDYGKLIEAQGFRLSYLPQDDQATASVGVANANRLITRQNLLGVVGHLNSGVAIPSGEVYHKVGLPSVSPANTNPLLTERKYAEFFRIVGRDDVQGPAAAQYLVRDAQAKTFFVINDKTSYGQGLADAFAAEVRKLGGRVIENTGMDEKETDFSAVLNRIDAAQPDVVFYGGIYSQGGPLVKQMREKGIDAIFSGGDGLDSSEFEKLGGKENIANTIYTTTAVPLSQFAAGAKFSTDYRNAYKKNPESYSIYGYDAARVMIEGIAAAIKANNGNRPTRKQVADAIAKTNMTGLTGRIKFNAKGDLENAKYVVLKIDAAGYSSAKIQKVLEVKAP